MRIAEIWTKLRERFVLCAWSAGSMSLRFAALGALVALLVALSLAPTPISPFHAFAILGVGLALLSVHLALARASDAAVAATQRITNHGDHVSYRFEQLRDLQWELMRTRLAIVLCSTLRAT